MPKNVQLCLQESQLCLGKASYVYRKLQLCLGKASYIYGKGELCLVMFMGKVSYTQIMRSYAMEVFRCVNLFMCMRPFTT